MAVPHGHGHQAHLRNLRLHLASWNVGNSPPFEGSHAEELNAFVPLLDKEPYDICAFSLQECEYDANQITLAKQTSVYGLQSEQWAKFKMTPIPSVADMTSTLSSLLRENGRLYRSCQTAYASVKKDSVSFILANSVDEGMQSVSHAQFKELFDVDAGKDLPKDAKEELTKGGFKVYPSLVRVKAMRITHAMLNTLFPESVYSVGFGLIDVAEGDFLSLQVHPEGKEVSVVEREEFWATFKAVSESSLGDEGGEGVHASHFVQRLQDHLGEEYKLYYQSSLMEIHLIIFVNKKIIHSVSGLEGGRQSTAIGSASGNKGGVAAVFQVFGTSFCFLATHLAAHLHQLHARQCNVLQILDGLRLGNSKIDITQQFDHFFWFGDLNYRIDLQPQTPPSKYLCPSPVFDGNNKKDDKDNQAKVVQMAKDKKFAELFSFDQLQREIAAERLFCGFQEGSYSFAPTFKVKPLSYILVNSSPLHLLISGNVFSEEQCQTIVSKRPFASMKEVQQTLGLSDEVMKTLEKAGIALEQVISYSAQRVPSYCDRILWRSCSSLVDSIKQLEFTSVPQCTTSDHIPVRSLFQVDLYEPVAINPHTSSPVTVVFNSMKMLNIPKLDLVLDSDPFIIFHTNPPNLLATASPKSSVKYNKRNAEWKQSEIPELVLNLAHPSDLSRIDLIMTAWDSDNLSADDYIGSCVVPLSALAHSDEGNYSFSVNLTQYTISTPTVLEGSFSVWHVGRKMKKNCTIS